MTKRKGKIKSKIDSMLFSYIHPCATVNNFDRFVALFEIFIHYPIDRFLFRILKLDKLFLLRHKNKNKNKF